MDARALISDLRAGRAPSADALRAFAAGLADGTVSDAQAGAFAMAACLNGLGDGGAVALTMGMRDSGDVMTWDLPGPVVDKHSTGGVGDPVSLILAPALASLGCYVPMISGRGLGHTGGTLDKLESIPGLSTDLDEARFRAVVGEVGCAIVSATTRLAPADRRLYAIRDVTGTVESLDLIVASILSKKLAGGIDTLVLDVKAGSGAFMADVPAARALARALVDTARGAGCACDALISDMNQPLAPACGNALEVRFVLDAIAGRGDPSDLMDLVNRLGAQALTLAGMADDDRAGIAAMKRTIASGAAAERLGRMIAAMGGPADVLDDPCRHLPVAPVVRDVAAPRDGWVTAIDGQALGQTVVALGGGRIDVGDPIDPAVGLDRIVRLNRPVKQGEPLARVHARDDTDAARAIHEVQAAFRLEDEPPGTTQPLIHEVLQ
ncbi:thymidine phosphorylase [Oceaniglobus indicus]|uniref:thymidine phosphorylase n=1 Tax=Oceaniglobus indicus TaxID=2047749 RepID=UPI000C189697|nr:thymidine phosphorylase [Oceaniglobus indicus]